MKKLITLALAALALSPLINASDKEREINEKPVKPAVIQPVITKQTLFWDSIYKASGHIQEMINDDLEQSDKTGDEFLGYKRSLVKQAGIEAWLQYTNTTDDNLIKPETIKSFWEYIEKIVTAQADTYAQTVKSINLENLIDLYPFCHYLLLSNKRLVVLEEEIARKTSKAFAKNNTFFTTDVGKKLNHLFTYHGFEKRMKRLSEPMTLWIEKDKTYRNSATFSFDEKLFTAISGDIVKIWDSETGKHLETLQPKHTCNVFFNPQGKRIMTCGPMRKTAQIWDYKTKTILHTLKHAGSIHTLTFSHKGEFVAASSGDNNIVKIWDSETGELLHNLQLTGSRGSYIAFSPDDTLIAASTLIDDTTTIWDVKTGKLLQGNLSGTLLTTFNTTPIAFSPNGKQLVTIQFGGSVILWDINTGAMISALPKEKWTRTSTFSTNGKLVATEDDKNSIYIWDAQKGDLRYTLPPFPGSVNLSPAGSYLALGSNEKVELLALASPLSLSSLATLKILTCLKKNGGVIDLEKNISMKKLINSLPTHIKNHYLNSGTIKNPGSVNEKVRNFFGNGIGKQIKKIVDFLP